MLIKLPSSLILATKDHTLQIDGQVVSEGCRSYKGTVLWGQLVGWFKQTVANPEASLSQDRRGTLSNPIFSGSFVGSTMEYPFQKRTQTTILKARMDFLSHIQKKPSYNWPPVSAKWSYKNPQKIYGTLLFENQILSERFPNYLPMVLENIDKAPEEQIEFFEGIEEKLEGLSSFGFLKSYEKYQRQLTEFKETDFKLFPPKYVKEKRKRNTSLFQTMKEEYQDEFNDEQDVKSPKLAKKKKTNNGKSDPKKVKIEVENEPQTKQETIEDPSQNGQKKSYKNNTENSEAKHKTTKKSKNIPEFENSKLKIEVENDPITKEEVLVYYPRTRTDQTMKNQEIDDKKSSKLAKKTRDSGQENVAQIDEKIDEKPTKKTKKSSKNERATVKMEVESNAILPKIDQKADDLKSPKIAKNEVKIEKESMELENNLNELEVDQIMGGGSPESDQYKIKHKEIQIEKKENE